jgi:hypothetical protein
MLDETITATSIGGLPIRKAAQDRPSLNMLIYGAYGAGKTLLAGSADAVPEMQRVLFIDIEGGTFTLHHKYPNTDVVRVTDWPQLRQIYDELRAGIHTQYRTIVIDSLSEANLMNMDQTMRDLVTKKPERNEDVPDIREWLINQKQTVRFVRRFRDLPVSVIFTALVKEDKIKATGNIMSSPQLPGQLSGRIPALFDEVFYLYVKKIKLPGEPEEAKAQDHRLLLTGQTETVRAKDRSGQLPIVMVDPTMKMIHDIMMGKELQHG